MSLRKSVHSFSTLLDLITLLVLSSQEALASSGASVNELLSVEVHLQLGQDTVPGLEGNLHGSAVDLLDGDLVNVDTVLAALDTSNLALLIVVAALHDNDLVARMDGESLDAIALLELLGHRSGHLKPALCHSGIEVPKASFVPSASHVQLCHRAPEFPISTGRFVPFSHWRRNMSA